MNWRSCLICILAWCPAASAPGGGGMVLEDDMCIIWIDFYSAHFTAYQPASRGNEQFCQELPDTGQTIFVLDYLHQSLREVPVDLRIIRNVTGQGRFVKLQHVEQVGDLEQHTVFYQPPVVRSDASFQAEFELAGEGDYIGIVSAGHPTSDETYTAVFAFEVGQSNTGFFVAPALVIGLLVFYAFRRRKLGAVEETEEAQ
jgi:hypothetical protein